MADGGFPGQHTTTTTVTSNTTVQTNLRFDPSYMRTIPGILKAVQIVSEFSVSRSRRGFIEYDLLTIYVNISNLFIFQ